MANFTNHPPTRNRGVSAVNTSGIPGVSFKVREYQYVTSIYVQVSYADAKGKLHNYQRSIDKYGVEGALKYALSMRRKMGAKNIPTLARAVELFRQWERAYTPTRV